MSMVYEGEFTTRNFADNKIEELEKRLDGFPEKLCEGGRKLLKMTDADVQFVHTADAIPSFGEPTPTPKKSSKPPKFERQRVLLFSDCIIFAAKKKLAGVSTRNLAFRGRIFVHEMRLRNAPTGTDNRERTLSYMRQTVDGVDTYTVVFASPSDKEEWWMGLDDVINGAKRDMCFGLKLHELMTTNQREVGKDVPTILIKCIEFLEKHAMDAEGIYRISGSSTDIDSYRAKFNKGAPIRFVNASDIHLVSGLLKLWLRDLREPLCTSGLFNEFIKIISEDGDAPDDAPAQLKIVVDMLPVYERFSLHELMLHLRRVAQHSDKNNMKADNLAIVIGPNVLRSPDLNPVNVHKTYSRVFKVIELMIEKVDEIFEGVADQRRKLVDNYKDEAAREKAQFRSVRKQTDTTKAHSADLEDSSGSYSDTKARRTSIDARRKGNNSAAIEQVMGQWKQLASKVRAPASGVAALQSVLARSSASQAECDAILQTLRGIDACVVPTLKGVGTSGGSQTLGRSPRSMTSVLTTSPRLAATRGTVSERSHNDKSKPTIASARSLAGPPPRQPPRLNRALSGGLGRKSAGPSPDWNVRAVASRSKPPAVPTAPRAGVKTPKEPNPPPSSKPAAKSTSPPTTKSSVAARVKAKVNSTSNTSSGTTSTGQVKNERLSKSAGEMTNHDEDEEDDDSTDAPAASMSAKDFVLQNQRAAERESRMAKLMSSPPSGRALPGAPEKPRSAPVNRPPSPPSDSSDSEPPPPTEADSSDEDDGKASPRPATDESAPTPPSSKPPPSAAPPPVPPDCGPPTRAPPPSGEPATLRKKPKVCGQCGERKAKHRVTLKSGEKRLLCVECVQAIPSSKSKK